MADLTERPLLDPTGFPRELLALRRWVVYLADKRPMMPDLRTPASSTDSATWSDAKTVLGAIDRAPREAILGPGCVLGDVEDGRVLAGIDVDGCRNPKTGELEDVAAAIVEAMQSYAEASPSGRGIHVLFYGRLPEGRSRRGNVEAYDHGRYFTMSGVRLNKLEIEPREREARLVWEAFIREPEKRAATPSPVRNVEPLNLSDLDVIERATSARNGAKVARLLAGDATGYTSPSEADAALAACLGYWSEDPAQIERLIRQSGLFRASKEQRNSGYYARTAARFAGGVG